MKASFTQFYNQILIGRLMNRLSKDIYNIDMLFPNQIYNLSIQFTNLIMPLITSLIFLNYVAYPIVLIFVIVLLIFTISYYKCLTEMTRIESVSKSPVFTYYQQMIRGLLYVRSCLPKKLILYNYQNNIDLDLGNQMYLAGLQQWFSQASSIITNIFQSILFIVCLLFPNDNPAMTYLIVIQMSNVSQLLVSVAVSYGNLLMYTISFERCLHLSNDIEYDDYTHGIAFNTKNIGKITLSNASFQYPNNQKDVLSNISLQIESGDKIGIVGRTGAGKSSIIMALLRMIHITNGDVQVDDVDVNDYLLCELRKKFSVIPQESLIYKGTLKENLDPYGIVDDSCLENVCQSCQLYSMKSFQDYKLDTQIQQNGCNLSLGEKQLITIARCMIENRQIILVDEATANIDNPTEELIKKIFQVYFKNQTMITIAHKVSTIMESDKIVVLSAGQIIECDSPNSLLKQPKSEFRQIVDLINKNL